MSTFSTLEALSTLCSSIPEWNTRLVDLNGQIDLRQIELAQLTENWRPPTRSLKNKGSTESLRPQDGDDNQFSNIDDQQDNIQINPFNTPKSQDNKPTPRPDSSTARAAAVNTPPPPTSNPRPSPHALTRQSSQPTTPTQPPIRIRKRKTDSLASAESSAPKYRTRSMIIVYYDSAVQTAFEELVKFVSGSRNNMRKGKMTAKMAQMRKAAEMEVDKDDDEGLNDLVMKSGSLLGAPKNVSIGRYGQSVSTGVMEADETSSDMPQLRFVSTRNMGPSRDMVGNRFGSKLSTGMLRGYGRYMGAASEEPDVFDDIDKGLEWCQGQCERAAHQFLRDGDCTEEIDEIKRKLGEVREEAQKEMERIKKEEAELLAKGPTRAISEKGRSRELRNPQMRKEYGTLKDLQVDDMEVDEGVDDLDIPRPMFRRSRDVARR